MGGLVADALVFAPTPPHGDPCRYTTAFARGFVAQRGVSVSMVRNHSSGYRGRGFGAIMKLPTRAGKAWNRRRICERSKADEEFDVE